ncbi:dATP/dGTP pyrophosphohydrolase domain-containing protein [Nocardioides sp. 31GB23]|uniref:dATP/dGTP pyrophosphohydrolase domain-containing protein n=1 Tax=Nocardioides sp. 31GB23 TaxID=3156065 RepID=UPI0032AF2813
MTGPAIDIDHIENQRAWSIRTFGPRHKRGPLGPLAHIRKELDEVAAEPHDLEEWVDVMILALDGAWRAGHEPEQIIAAIKAKQAKSEARIWPDWRGVPADQAIEHVRVDQ